MSQIILNTGKSVRQTVLHQVQAIPEELFDIYPQAFSNTIRWNVGHIIVSLDSLFSRAFPFSSNLPEGYAGLFKRGTKPSDWSITPPAKEELVQYLSGQLNRLSEIRPSILEQPLKSPIQIGSLSFEAVGELFNFAFIHETVHSTTITCLRKVIQHQS